MVGDPITMGLILSAVATSASVAQQVGVASATKEKQKKDIEFNDAQQENEAAQAEKGRQQSLRQALSAQRAALASSGVDGSSQSLQAQTDKLLSQSNQMEQQRATKAIQKSQTVDNFGINQSIVSGLNQTGSLLNSFK